tara:strand:- start:1803 stop:2897 length:1095 start_codon:yes stop_codon:yes gene_type:complete
MEPPSSAKDRYFMRNALNLSLRGVGNTYPNPSVGAVIVKNNQIISRGWTQPGGTPHAEVNALKGRKYLGATLYTTLEPCAHFGKTAPCVDKIIESKIKRVVIGLKDPNPIVNGKGIKKLKKKKIKITIGVLKNEIKRINLGFFNKIKKNKPFIASKIAISRNGKMINKRNKWITSKDSREHGNFLRAKFDAIITGINTVLKDDPLLNCRHFGMQKLSPIRFILDSGLKLKENSKIAKTAKNNKTFVLTNTNNKEKISKLKKSGLIIKILDENVEKINLEKAVLLISKMGFNNLLLESGPRLNSAFIKLNLINKIYYFQSKNKVDLKLLSVEKDLNLNNFKNLSFKLSLLKNIGNDSLRIFEKNV